MHRVLRTGGVLVISTHHPAADWQRLGGSYFVVEPVTETWSRGWEITAWRIPLTQLVGEFADGGFLIERLVEPSPDPRMAETHPGSFRKLSTEPAFIFFRLVPTLTERRVDLHPSRSPIWVHKDHFWQCPRSARRALVDMMNRPGLFGGS